MPDHAPLATPERLQLLREEEAKEAAEELMRYENDVRLYGKCVGWDGWQGCGAILYPHRRQDDYACNDYPQCTLP